MCIHECTVTNWRQNLKCRKFFYWNLRWWLYLINTYFYFGKVSRFKRRTHCVSSCRLPKSAYMVGCSEKCERFFYFILIKKYLSTIFQFQISRISRRRESQKQKSKLYRVTKCSSYDVYSIDNPGGRYTSSLSFFTGADQPTEDLTKGMQYWPA